MELDIHICRHLLYLDSHPEEYLKYLGKWTSVEYSYWLIALQRGKGDIKRNVLNLGVVICAERWRRCRDQEDERSRASSICGPTVLATQTGLIRRGVSNDGPAVPSHIGATLSLGQRSGIHEGYIQRYHCTFFWILNLACSHFSFGDWDLKVGVRWGHPNRWG